MTFSYWILRALITGVVLASAVGKSLDLAGFVEVLATYHTDIPNCGCFGRFFPQPLRWYSPLEDLVLVAMSYALWHCARKPSRLR